jgi:hypothetical protein
MDATVATLKGLKVINPAFSCRVSDEVIFPTTAWFNCCILILPSIFFGQPECFIPMSWNNIQFRTLDGRLNTYIPSGTDDLFFLPITNKFE